MSYWSKLQRLTAIAVGCSTGVSIYLYLHRSQDTPVYTSLTTNTFVPQAAKLNWDFNWDHREPSSLLKPLKSTATPEDENVYNEKLEAIRPTAVRHLFLIRHGQYNLDGATDVDRFLTELGRRQAGFTGERLKILQVPFDKMIRSTMTRAQETGKIISTHIANMPIENCSLIEEGAPIAPEPPIGHWHPEPYFFQDGARIEAGFRKYFHRANAKQKEDSYTLIVCHANVIRYYVCRALQIPPEAWLRISLNHASITWISIQPSGRVTLRLLGDSGHIPPECVTSR